jgi:ribosomal protein L37AE/L43A
MMMGVICSSTVDGVQKRRHVCPDCRRRTTFVGVLIDAAGWNPRVIATCLGCGRQWVGTEWQPLPPGGGGRKINIDRAKARWRAWQREPKKVAHG